jgi:hypothetical protein
MEFSDTIGIVGTTFMLTAFLLNLANKLDAKSPFYMGLNFVGGICASTAAYIIEYEPFIILEGTWGLISGFALFNHIKNKIDAKRNKNIN